MEAKPATGGVPGKAGARKQTCEAQLRLFHILFVQNYSFQYIYIFLSIYYFVNVFIAFNSV
jgi:hypothetical protein